MHCIIDHIVNGKETIRLLHRSHSVSSRHQPTSPLHRTLTVSFRFRVHSTIRIVVIYASFRASCVPYDDSNWNWNRIKILNNGPLSRHTHEIIFSQNYRSCNIDVRPKFHAITRGDICRVSFCISIFFISKVSIA